MKMRTFLALVLLSLGPVFGARAQADAPVTPLLQISIYFAGGSAYVYPEEAQRLKTFLDAVPAIDNYGIEVQGHTDDIGDRTYNLRLSAARSAMVREQLLAYPLDVNAIELLPLGEDAPAYDNATWQGKLNNRRVDVILRPML